MRKYKRTIWIAFATVFILALFIIKTRTTFNNQENATTQENKIEAQGLTYNGNDLLGDLVNKDADGDGVLDWEEGLWGTDPTKRDTDGNGLQDNVEIEKLKKQSVQIESAAIAQNEDNLTETDKFSREFFSTVASLNQAGAMDQTTVDKLSSSLAEHMENSSPKRIFKISDIKIVGTDTKSVTQIYADAIGITFKNHTITASISDILSESMTDSGDIDVKVLDKLDPIIKDIRAIVDEMSKMNVPAALAQFHLEAINSFERIAENLSDIKLVDQDVVVAISAISQYEKNDEYSKIFIQRLISAIDGKLNN